MSRLLRSLRCDKCTHEMAGEASFSKAKIMLMLCISVQTMVLCTCTCPLIVDSRPSEQHTGLFIHPKTPQLCTHVFKGCFNPLA